MRALAVMLVSEIGKGGGGLEVRACANTPEL